MKKCSVCKKLRKNFFKDSRTSDGLYSSCKKCHQNYLKLNSWKSIYESNARYPEKVRARQILNRAKYKGKVSQKPCFICCKSRTQAHHENYNKPLEVVWLCIEHHNHIHYEQNKM